LAPLGADGKKFGTSDELHRLRPLKLRISALKLVPLRDAKSSKSIKHRLFNKIEAE
jgi:hypothetical protein